MNHITLRPQGIAFVIPLICFIISASGIVVFILSPSARSDTKFDFSLVTMTLLSIFAGLNFIKTRFILMEDEFIHESAFKTVIIEYKNVKSVKVVEVYTLHAIIFNLSVDAGDKKIVTNIKSYSKKSLKLLASRLIEKCVNARIDTTTRELMDGKMPSFFRITKD